MKRLGLLLVALVNAGCGILSHDVRVAPSAYNMHFDARPKVSLKLGDNVVTFADPRSIQRAFKLAGYDLDDKSETVVLIETKRYVPTQYKIWGYLSIGTLTIVPGYWEGTDTFTATAGGSMVSVSSSVSSFTWLPLLPLAYKYLVSREEYYMGNTLELISRLQEAGALPRPR